jgi:hypothetical protein
VAAERRAVRGRDYEAFKIDSELQRSLAANERVVASGDCVGFRGRRALALFQAVRGCDREETLQTAEHCQWFYHAYPPRAGIAFVLFGVTRTGFDHMKKPISSIFVSSSGQSRQGRKQC